MRSQDGGKKSKVRDQNADEGGPKTDDGAKGPEAIDQKPELGDQKPEVRDPGTMDGEGPGDDAAAA